MKLSRNQILLISGGILLIGAIVFVMLYFVRDKSTNFKGQLTVWGVFDQESAVRQTLFADFSTKNPGIKLIYVQKDPQTYEQDLINAKAAGTGPDVFYFKNTWLPKHGDKLVPVNPAFFPVKSLLATFPDVVAKDFADSQNVYALPLYVDTLAMFYNKQIFDNAGIALPPQTWEGVAAASKQITRFDQNGRISRSGAALGASAQSINEATDLLNLIMIQSGSTMLNGEGTRVDFGGAGAKAIGSYTNYANPRSSHYTWDPSQIYSIDAFAEGKVGMIFNYAFQIPQIQAKNPYLNFTVSPMPQFANAKKSINYASYFGLAVSNQTKTPDLAWDFVINSTIDPAANGSYLVATNRSPALRSLIDTNIDNPDLGLFVRQSLTATSWPQIDATAVDEAFTHMLDSINTGQLTLDVAIRQAEASINSLVRRRLGN